MRMLPVLATTAAAAMTMTMASAQTAGMMHDGGSIMGWIGASGGAWAPFLLIVVLGGLVAWVVQREHR